MVNSFLVHAFGTMGISRCIAIGTFRLAETFISSANGSIRQ
jgi:hypothetical protein